MTPTAPWIPPKRFLSAVSAAVADEVDRLRTLAYPAQFKVAAARLNFRSIPEDPVSPMRMPFALTGDHGPHDRQLRADYGWSA
jgi:hypothetical protein